MIHHDTWWYINFPHLFGVTTAGFLAEILPWGRCRSFPFWDRSDYGKLHRRKKGGTWCSTWHRPMMQWSWLDIVSNYGQSWLISVVCPIFPSILSFSRCHRNAECRERRGRCSSPCLAWTSVELRMSGAQCGDYWCLGWKMGRFPWFFLSQIHWL